MTMLSCKAARGIAGARVRAVALVLLLAGAVLQAAPAGAQASLFGDWARRCEDGGEFSGRCFVRQRLTLKSSGKLLFEIAAGYPLGGRYPLLLLSAPLGSYLPPGITLEVDDTGEWRAVVAYCNSDGCHAYYRMTAELYRMFRQGRWLNVSIVDGTRRAHRFQVSLNGFSAAIDSLAAQQ